MFFWFFKFRAAFTPPRARAVRARRRRSRRETRRRERAVAGSLCFWPSADASPPPSAARSRSLKHTGLDQRIDREAGSSASVASVTNPSAADEQPVAAHPLKRDARRPPSPSRETHTRGSSRRRVFFLGHVGHVVPVPHLDRGLLERPRGGLAQKARGASRLLFFCAGHQRRAADAATTPLNEREKSRVFIGFVGFRYRRSSRLDTPTRRETVLSVP